MSIKKKITLGIAALALVLVQACGSESSDDTQSLQDEMGDVLIGVTDAPGDFVHYEVNVKSLKLTHQNGAIVETLPRETNIDFAQYVDLTEFLTVATVPRGTYVKGTLVLDYSNASIFVENENGDSVEANSIVDESGAEVTTLELEVNLENANRLVIAPGVPAHLTIDFDLQASNTVDLSAEEGVEVTVEPVLLAELSRTGAKTHRARGALRTVNLDRSFFSIYLRPGRNALNDSHRANFLAVLTDDETHFEINGELFEGSAGLTELDQQQTLTAVIARGKYRLNPVRFVADEVYAGTSVPGGDKDIVRGTIISRSGDAVTVKGASLIRADGIAEFNQTIVVNMTDSTMFSKQASVDEVSGADVSAGQHINATGSISRDESGMLSLNTSDGSLRMLLTYLGGAIVDESEYLVMSLSSIGGRNPAIIDYSGTGVSAEYDAVPFAYEIDKNGLQANTLGIASTLKVAGHVKAFGMAPADFVAETLVDVSNLPATLRVGWIDPMAQSIDTSVFNSMVLDLSGTGRFHHVSQAGSKLDLLTQTEPTTIEFSDSIRSHFVLIQDQTRVLHSDASTFVADLDTRIASGSLPTGMEAWGRYANADNVLTASRVVIRLR